jgi:hypothetical protein
MSNHSGSYMLNEGLYIAKDMGIFEIVRKIFEKNFVKRFPKEAFIYRLRDSVGAWNR